MISNMGKRLDELQNQEYRCFWCRLHHKEILCFMTGKSNCIILCTKGQFNIMLAYVQVLFHINRFHLKLPFHPCPCPQRLKAQSKILYSMVKVKYNVQCWITLPSPIRLKNWCLEDFDFPKKKIFICFKL